MGSSQPKTQKVIQNIAKIEPQFFDTQIKNMKFQQRNDKFKQKSDETKKELTLALQLLKKNKLLTTGQFKKLQVNSTKNKSNYFPQINQKIVKSRVLKRQTKSHNEKPQTREKSKEIKELVFEDLTDISHKDYNQTVQMKKPIIKKDNLLQPISGIKSSYEIKERAHKLNKKKITKSQKFLPGQFAYRGLSVVYDKEKKLHTQSEVEGKV